MTLETLPLTLAMVEVAAALHAAAGLDEYWDARAFADLLSLPGTGGVIALTDHGPAGLILWRTAADEGEILTVCTAPDQRRSGVGRRLLDTAIDAVSSAGGCRLFLEVAVDNAAALGLYQSSGFTGEGRRPGYYRRGGGSVDALILARDI